MGSGSDPGGAHHHHQQRPWYSLFRHMPLEVSVAWRQGEGVIYTTKDEERERLEAGGRGQAEGRREGTTDSDAGLQQGSYW